MRRLLPCLLACALFLLGGCFDDRPSPASIAGPIQTAPPATTAVDAAKQSLIAGGANASAVGNTVGAKAASLALKAEDTEGAISGLGMFYGLAVLFGIAAALLAYEGNLKLAGLCGAGAAASVLGPILVTGLLRHQALVCWLGFLSIIVVLAYHYRSTLKVHALALEHALGSGEREVSDYLHTAHPQAKVESLLSTTWAKVRSEAHAIAAKLHLVSSAAAAQAVPVAPPVIITPIVAPAKPPTTITTP